MAQDAGKVGGFETPSPDPGNYGTLSSDERKALLKRAVVDLTREARARVRSEGEFDAVLVRGSTVNHRLHFLVVVVLAALALESAQVVGAGPLGLVIAMAVPAV